MEKEPKSKSSRTAGLSGEEEEAGDRYTPQTEEKEAQREEKQNGTRFLLSFLFFF